jgi:hypothetical protein
MTIAAPTIVDVGRSLEAVLQRCMGSWANGQLTVRTRNGGPNVTLKAGSFAIPIISGTESELESGTVYVKRNPATWVRGEKGLSGSGGDWEITAAGTTVDVESLQGGESVNQPTGTLYRWDEPIDGIEETSECVTAVSGGNFAANRLRQVVQYRQLKTGEPQELFQGNLGQFPAASLAWAGSTPSDGPMQTSPGPRTSRAQANTMLYRTQWVLFVISSNYQSSNRRLREGLLLVDDLLHVLADCKTARELRVSTAPGIEILSADPFAANARVYVDTIRFATHTALKRRPQDETFSPWLLTRTRTFTPEQGGSEIALPDQTFAQDGSDVAEDGHLVTTED